jgi:PEP-CTERM motif
MKKLSLLSAVAIFAFTGGVQAATVGGLQFTQDGFDANFTPDSFTLPDESILSNIFSNPASPSGIFTGLGGTVITVLDMNSSAFAPAGVSTNAAAPSSVASVPFFQLGGVSGVDEYTFDLESIYMTNSDPSDPSEGTASVLGTGILVDDTNLSSPEYSASFSISDILPGGPVTGTFTAVSVPEPSTWAMLLGGLGLLAFWRLRTRRA